MTDLRAFSYNVRYANPDDAHDVWEERRAGVAALLRFHAPAVLGLQEPLPAQFDYLADQLPAYELVGQGRADGDGEHVPVGYRRDRFERLESNTFWLSDAPDDVSVAWGASHPRVATWVRLAEREGDAEFVVCNTHFDHESARARRRSADLVRDRLAEVAGDAPRILLGDLNCTPGSEPHDRLTAGDLRDAAAVARYQHGPATSLTDFQTLIHGRRIDHVLVGPRADVRAFATLTDRDDRGRYPSDHLPVAARLRL